MSFDRHFHGPCDFAPNFTSSAQCRHLQRLLSVLFSFVFSLAAQGQGNLCPPDVDRARSFPTDFALCLRRPSGSSFPSLFSPRFSACVFAVLHRFSFGVWSSGQSLIWSDGIVYAGFHVFHFQDVANLLFHGISSLCHDSQVFVFTGSGDVCLSLGTAF